MSKYPYLQRHEPHTGTGVIGAVLLVVLAAAMALLVVLVALPDGTADGGLPSDPTVTVGTAGPATPYVEAP